ncbi:Fc.00g020320.m01.CDS01 [Cosmosporella sp. VM-42]
MAGGYTPTHDRVLKGGSRDPHHGHGEKGHRRHPIPHAIRTICVVAFGEFCGTFMFLLLSFIGAQTALSTNAPGNSSAPLLPSTLMYIAASFGTALAVNVWIFYRVSGGMFNPAVTLGLVLVGAVKPLRGVLIFVTQLVAAIAAAAVTEGLIPGPLMVANTLGSGTSVVQGLFIEMFLTTQLVLTVFFLAVEKHRGTFLAPIGIGISVFIAHMVATNWTGTSINPARSFGPAVITGFVGYHWIYWLGPFMGALLAWVVYFVFKWLEYEEANPGQDDDDVERGETVVKAPSAQLEESLERLASRNSRPSTTARGGNDDIPRSPRSQRRNDSIVDGQMSRV